MNSADKIVRTLLESDDMDQFVRDSGATDIPHNSPGMGWMRRVVGRSVVLRVDIVRNTSISHGTKPADGLIKITYMHGPYRRTWEHGFKSFSVLQWVVRNWRNLYGAPLFVNGQSAGKVEYSNPALAD